MDFFATCAKGTEGALRDELRELRLRRVRADRGGVHFSGPPEDGWRACLESRVAVRVLGHRATFDARGESELYDGVRAIDLSDALSPAQTLAVKATCRSSRLTHSQFIAQKTKDAVVDGQRDRFGARPSVDLESPDVLVVVHLVRDRADVYLDFAGEPLHRRGYRPRIGDAPLKETLAAAMVRLSGWDRAQPLVDPMCGSGTLAIEAWGWSRGVAPGLTRARFGFERWASFDAGLRERWRALKDAARARARADGPEIRGSDADPRMIELARANAADARAVLGAAGGEPIVLERGDVRQLDPQRASGAVVTNPPYGERLELPDRFFDDMARALVAPRPGVLSVLAGAPRIEDALRAAARRRADRWLMLFNGPIECRLLTYTWGPGRA